MAPVNFPRSQMPFKTERAGDRKPFKPKRWSHQQDLEKLKGKKVDLVYPNGEWVRGVLLEADQFTLRVDIGSENHQSVLTVFKHSLRSYSAV
jgi:hypothetical protein